LLGRRYYPLGIGAAFLSMVVGLFPSTIPLGLGGVFSAGPAPAQAAAPSAPAAPRGTGPSSPWAPTTGPFPEPTVSAQAGGWPVVPSAGVEPAGPAPASPAPTGPSGPVPPSASCPIPVPTTGSPLDAVILQAISMCETLAGGPGSLPSPPGAIGVPGSPGSSSAPPGAGTAPFPGPAGWVVVDRPITSPNRVPSPASAASGTLGAAVGAAPAVVLLGLVQGTGVPPGLAGDVGALRQHGALVGLVLVPVPGSSGGAPAFGAWAARTIGALPGTQFIAVAAGSPPAGTDAAAVAADVASGLAVATTVAPGEPAGVWWSDGGTSPADAGVWSALATAPSSRTAFVAGSFPRDGACAGAASLSSAANGTARAGRPFVVAEGLPSPGSAGSDVPPTCLTGSAGGDAALWRVGAGPVRRAGPGA